MARLRQGLGETPESPENLRRRLGAAQESFVADRFTDLSEEEIMAGPPAAPGTMEALTMPTIPQATERKRITAGQAALTKAKEKPEDWMTAYKSFTKELAGQEPPLPTDQQSAFRQQIQEINNTINAARNKYEKDKDRLAWAEVAEKAGQALTQLGAGLYGLKHGVDLSGIKFNRTDWDRKLDQSFKEMREARIAGEEDISRLRGQERELIGRALKDERARKDLMTRFYFTKLKEQQRLKDAAAKAAERGDKKEATKIDKEQKRLQAEARKNAQLYDKVLGPLQTAVDDDDEEAAKKLLDKVGGTAKEEIIGKSMEPGLLWGENLNLDTVIKEVKDRINFYKSSAGEQIQQPTTPAAGGLSPEEQKELEELEKLEAEGKL